MMKVRCLWFAWLRQKMGASMTEVELPTGTRVADLFTHLFADPAEAQRVQRCTCVAINCTYATPATEIHAGDEIALIPPVAGG